MDLLGASHCKCLDADAGYLGAVLTIQTNACQFILYIFLGPETRYIEGSSTASPFQRQYLHIRRIDPRPLRVDEFTHPLSLFCNIPVLLAAVAYAMVFVFASVLNSVEVPQLLQSKFELNAQQLGLQFLGLIIGSLLGEQLGGILSDLWMSWRARRIGQLPAPEFRLWLSYIGFLLAIAGMVIFLVCTEQARPGKWTVVPVVGTGIAAFGNQVVTTVLTTYAVDTYPEDAGSVGVFINLVRSTWGFIGPFWCASTPSSKDHCRMLIRQVSGHVRASGNCSQRRNYCGLDCRGQFHSDDFSALAGAAISR